MSESLHTLTQSNAPTGVQFSDEYIYKAHQAALQRHFETTYKIAKADTQEAGALARLGASLEDDGPHKGKIRYVLVYHHSGEAYAVGDTVYIHSGLMRQQKTQAEIASILAHEISHIERGDTATTSVKDKSPFHSISKDRIHELHADSLRSVGQKLVRLGFNPLAYEEVLKRLGEGGGAAHGATIDRRAAYRAQLRLIDYRETSTADTSVKDPLFSETHLAEKPQHSLFEEALNYSFSGDFDIAEEILEDHAGIFSLVKHYGDVEKNVIQIADWHEYAHAPRRQKRKHKKNGGQKEVDTLAHHLKLIEQVIDRKLLTAFPSLSQREQLWMRQALFLQGSQALNHQQKDDSVLARHTSAPFDTHEVQLLNSFRNSTDAERFVRIASTGHWKEMVGVPPHNTLFPDTIFSHRGVVPGFNEGPTFFEKILPRVVADPHERTPQAFAFLARIQRAVEPTDEGEQRKLSGFIEQESSHIFNEALRAMRETVKDSLKKSKTTKETLTTAARRVAPRLRALYQEYNSLGFARDVGGFDHPSEGVTMFRTLLTPWKTALPIDDIALFLGREFDQVTIDAAAESSPLLRMIVDAVRTQNRDALLHALHDVSADEMATLFGGTPARVFFGSHEDAQFFGEACIHSLLNSSRPSGESYTRAVKALQKIRMFDRLDAMFRASGGHTSDMQLCEQFHVGTEEIRLIDALFVARKMDLRIDVLDTLLAHHIDAAPEVQLAALVAFVKYSEVSTYGVNGHEVTKAVFSNEQLLALRHSFEHFTAQHTPYENLKAFLALRKHVLQSIFADSYNTNIYEFRPYDGHADFLAPLLVSICSRMTEGDLAAEGVSELKEMYRVVELLFNGDERMKSHLQNTIALQIVTASDFDEARAFLLEQSKQGKYLVEAADLFQEKFLYTKQQYFVTADDIGQFLDRVHKEGDAAVGRFVGVDLISVEALKHYIDPVELFEAALLSGTDDTKLRTILAPLWLEMVDPMGTRLSTIAENPKSFFESRDPNTFTTFIGFERFIGMFYTQMTPTDVELILQRLLLAPNGVLRTEKGIETLVRLLDTVIDAEPRELKNILQKTLGASVRSVDPAHFFRSITEIFKHAMFRKPSDPGRMDSIVRTCANKELDRSDGRLRAQIIRRLFTFDPEQNTGMQYASDAQEATLLARNRIREHFLRAGGAPESNAKNPVAVMLQVAQSLGAFGTRFLQMLPQYVDIPTEYQSQFDSIYDKVRGQPKITAWRTLAREAVRQDSSSELARFWEEVAYIGDTIGGGSLVTVYKAKLEDGSEHVVKILNPNAKAFIKQYVSDAKETCKSMKEYDYILPLLDDLESWLIADLESVHGESGSDVFFDLHNGAPVKVDGVVFEVSVPRARITHSHYVAIEESASGTSMVDNLKQERIAEDPRRAQSIVRALRGAYASQLDRIAVDGMTRIHADVHPGNILVDGNKMTWIDRTHTIRCTAEEMSMYAPLLREEVATQDLRAALAFMLQQPANVGKNISLPQVETRIMLSIARARLSGGDALDAALRGLHASGVKIPLPLMLLFKNEKAIRVLEKRVGIRE